MDFSSSPSSFLDAWWDAYQGRGDPALLPHKSEMRRCLALFATADGRAELWQQYPWFPLSDAHGQRSWTQFTRALRQAYAARSALDADTSEFLSLGPVLLWIRYSAAEDDLPWQMTPRALQHHGKACAIAICSRFSQWIAAAS